MNKHIEPLTRGERNNALCRLKTLTKEEMIHLIDSCPNVLESFRRNRIHHKAMEKEYGRIPGSSCFDCASIERKLGL
jgi:hypothetical protein